jgi:murein DD-endopeptidase MepM/ murein hydrolase activator NlpD
MQFKTYVKSLRWLGSLCVSGMFVFVHANAEAAILYIASDTFLKATTGQASGLADNQKCAFTKGQALEIASLVDGGAGHYRVTLPRNYASCALTDGYLYQPHTSTAALSVTVHTETFFKKTTASASTLPASSKCTVLPGVYPLSAAPTTQSSHFAANMKTLAPGCGFSSGFLYTGHTNAGITVLSLADSTYLKTSTADSSTLPAANKCLIAKGDYVMLGVPTTNGAHYNVNLNAKPANCLLQSGYVYFELTLLATPAGAGSGGTLSYVTPMPNGVAYSGDFSWCACRTIGTSPHIGQDWNADTAETSRAVADGTFVDKTFVSGCGHYLLLEDASGARWRYLHLNANPWQIGDTIAKGQMIGTHSDYPIPGQCGSGPHLHFERRTAGGFRDSEVFKTCQFGTSSCNYDPNKPFPGAGTVTPKLGTSLQNSLTDLVTEKPVTAFIVPVQASSAGACRRDPSGYASVNAKTLDEFQPRSSGLNVAHAASHAGAYKQLAISATLTENLSNQCSGKNCLVSWQVLAETSQGLKRLFFDASLRNRKAQVINAEQLCLPVDATGRLHLLVRDFQGAQYRTIIDLE